MRYVFLLTVVVLLVACGGPSEADLQATVQAAVQATARAEQVAADVAATQEAESACGEVALSEYADAIEDQMSLFEQQANLTGSTPRASIGTALQRLLDIQTETERMDVPECLAAYHEQVVSMMGLHRIAYETFAAQGNEALIQASLQLGGESLSAAKQGLADIRAGQVPPTPTPFVETPPPTP